MSVHGGRFGLNVDGCSKGYPKFYYSKETVNCALKKTQLTEQ